MYNKVETGILLLFSLVLLDLVSALPLDGDKRIDDWDNEESREINTVLPQNLDEETRGVQTAIDLSKEQNNEDLIPMETKIEYGHIPFEQSPYGGFGHSFIRHWDSNRVEVADTPLELHNQNRMDVNENPKNEHGRQSNEFGGAFDPKYNGKVQWSFDQDYFRDKAVNFQRSGQGAHPYHPYFNGNMHKYHHPYHPHHHGHHPEHHWKSVFRTESTQSTSTTQSTSVTNTTATIVPLIDIRMGK